MVILILIFAEWITDDLLSKIEKNEGFAKKLTNPKFMQAISEFQTNPQAAIRKYQDNAEMQTFLKDFCALLGKGAVHNYQHFHKCTKGTLFLNYPFPKVYNKNVDFTFKYFILRKHSFKLPHPSL